MRKLLVLAAIAAAASLGTFAPHAAAATWCGSGSVASDRLPDASTGAQVHVLYVVPSDAPDRFDTFRDSIATDVADIDAWWRSQDFTRTLRIDTYGFPSCGAGGGVDISDVRLPQAGGAFAPESGRFAALYSVLRGMGWNVDGKKYLVYYDGPAENSRLCGTGGGQIAFVWVQPCIGYADRAAVAAHELLHTLGAVPSGAPHRCSDSGHTCEPSRNDIMQPYIESFRPLAQFALDPGHDDYYAHPDSDPWLDVQASSYLRHLDTPIYPLAVGLSGGGATIVSDLPGVSCSAACTSTWDAGTKVTLTAAPAAGLRLVRWAGACTGAGDCELTLDAAKSATAVLGPERVRLALTIAGRGRVAGALACSRSCSRSFDGGERVVLRAVATRGWRFTGWSGACRGRAACTPSTDADVRVTARFAKRS